MNGKLFVVATPIGNLSDITKRALDVFESVEYIAAEDTRETHGLFQKLNISGEKKYITNNGYNENNSKKKIIELLMAGNDVAVVSDAGMPCISDPGSILVEAAAEAGIDVIGVCGASAVITAVAVSGFVKSNSDFAFFGFLPRKKNEIEEKLLSAVHSQISTGVFYESPVRIINTMEIISDLLPDAGVCLCNDLTKLYERIYRGTPGSVLNELKNNPNAAKGEYALVLDFSDTAVPSEETIKAQSAESVLVEYMLANDCDVKEAVSFAAKKSDFSKNQLKSASFRLKELFGSGRKMPDSADKNVREDFAEVSLERKIARNVITGSDEEKRYVGFVPETNELVTAHGTVKLPAFFPDGTKGTVACVDSVDLRDCGVQGIVMNTYHLLKKASVVKSVGGLHEFSNWQGPILTDSGGFQAFSLIKENSKTCKGSIDEKNGITFRLEGQKKAEVLSPEKCIQKQFEYGSDIMMCLDYCTDLKDEYAENEFSVDVTIKWAQRCLDEYRRQLRLRKIPEEKRPLLFAIIQGGKFKDLRKKCGDALKAMNNSSGFDGYGFGGWPIDETTGNIDADILQYTADQMEDGKPKYAMGLGNPQAVTECCKMGYNLFDCVKPTREARRNILYTFSGEDRYKAKILSTLSEDFIRNKKPAESGCTCFVCRNYSQAYLYHLAKSGDSLAFRFATIHNLRFYTELCDRIREDMQNGTFVRNDNDRNGNL